MKKLILAAFAMGGIFAVSAQTAPQKTKTVPKTVTTPSTTQKGLTIPRGNLNSDVRALNNNQLSAGNTLQGTMNSNLGNMNNGTINSANPNGTLPMSTGIVDNKVSSPGTVNIGTTGSLNTSGTVNTGVNRPMPGSGTVNTTTPTTPVKKTK
ncbi:hypothetical protein ASG31_03505 [Chryseobacterium sp. Leaf404]|uniref:hypothetical protein n=1 Tax=unclassified Chryseobacterium TaxID=2593645 RepID=UPI0006F46560|nr:MULTISPECIES: hypothetical protein [unclassified Chryseobacterium]KQT22404.1 hypothetical protein ASG31_03505 [Chryseobacterium sp. Leaf404]